MAGGWPNMPLRSSTGTADSGRVPSVGRTGCASDGAATAGVGSTAAGSGVGTSVGGGSVGVPPAGGVVQAAASATTINRLNNNDQLRTVSFDK